ncbi:MAG TPA: efflux RND transporter periplasmic adaptor subunit [Roseococcus sp.]|jgi:cobalt-zinc-cadmium efflux system membrane fusion protein|nr:efflux RND transporter periplasmic adaptor subunit [Roseococcus sp.]
MNVIHQDLPQAEARQASTILPLQAAEAPRRRPWLSIIGGLVAAGAAGWFIFAPAEHAAPAPSLQASTLPAGEFRLSDVEMRALRIEPVLVRTFRPERVAEGRIAVNEDRSTPMLSPYTGRVTRAFARLGERVAQGDPLYEIETPDVTGAANDLLAALDNAQKARVTLDQARREQARQQSLLSARAASARDVEQAVAALGGAMADERSAQAQISASRDKLRVLGRSSEQIAEIERTRQVSGIITVTAPLAGTITSRRASPGQWLSAGQGEPVFTIADLSTVWLVAAVREMDAPLMEVGQRVEVTVAALPGRRFEARIIRLSAGLDAATRRMTVMAEVPDPEGALRPEMFATFRIAVGEAQHSPVVPAGAVIFRGAEANVWVALEDNRFAMRSIKPGIRDGEAIQVTEGLREGERVVTGGALFIDRAARVD